MPPKGKKKKAFKKTITSSATDLMGQAFISKLRLESEGTEYGSEY